MDTSGYKPTVRELLVTSLSAMYYWSKPLFEYLRWQATALVLPGTERRMRWTSHRVNTSGDKPPGEFFLWQVTERGVTVTSHRPTGRVFPVTSHSASSSCEKPQCVVLRWQATGRVPPVTSHSARCYGDKPPHTDTSCWKPATVYK